MADKILALDQASRTTGWAIFVDGKLDQHGHFTLSTEDMGKRLQQIKDNVAKLIADNDINCVIFEDIQHQGNVANNVQTFKILAEVFGVIYEFVTEMELENYSVLASTWKSVLGIKGRARAEQKQNAQNWVLNNYGEKPIQDECDAICIGAYLLERREQLKTVEESFDWS